MAASPARQATRNSSYRATGCRGRTATSVRPALALGLPGVQPADPGPHRDEVEHPLDLGGGVGDPARPGTHGGAVGLDLVVGRRGVAAVDHEHRLAVEIAGVDDLRRRPGDARAGRDTWSTGTRASGTDATRSGSATGPRTMPTRGGPARSPSRMCSDVRASGRTAASGCSARKARMARISPALAAVAVAEGERRRAWPRRSSAATARSGRRPAARRGRRRAAARRPGSGPPAARALEQPHAELAAPARGCAATAAASRVQPSRGPAEVALLGDGDEVAQPAQVDPAGPRRQRYRCDMIRVRDGRGHRRPRPGQR